MEKDYSKGCPDSVCKNVHELRMSGGKIDLDWLHGKAEE